MERARLGHPRVFLRIEDRPGDVPVLLASLRPERRSGSRQRTLTPRSWTSATDAPSPDRPLHLILIDGSGFIFRAFHALPPMTRPDGTPVNAVFGFTNMLAKLLKEHVGTHIAVIFDAGRVTFRNRLYEDYKAHRPPPPDELIPQFALVREATEAFGVPAIELADWEADDLIAAYAQAATEAGGQVTIVSSDKDLMQLIRPGVEMLDPIKQKPIGPAEVMEKFGVTPGQDDRGAGADRRSDRQRARRAGHRPEGRRAADQRVRRPGERAGRRAGDEAVEAARHADRARREGAHIARAGRRCGEDAPMPRRSRQLQRKRRTTTRQLAGWLPKQGFRSIAARLGLDGECRAPIATTTVEAAPRRGRRRCR